MADANRVDAVDRSIIACLKQDARATSRSIADALGITEQTVAARIHRLEQANLLRVIAVLDMEAAGFTRFVIAGIQVSGRAPAEVATELVELPCVSSLASCLGGYELVAVLYARGEDDLYEQLERQIGAIRGVEEIESFLVLEQLLYRVDWAQLDSLSPVTAIRLERGDRLDGAILDQLREDGRTSLREVSRRLGRSEGTIRTRLRQMENEGVCRLQAVTDISIQPGSSWAWIAIKTRRGWMRRVCEAIVRKPEIAFLGITLGRFDVLALVIAEDREAIARLVFDDVALMGGVQRVEAWNGLHSYKNDLRVARLSAVRTVGASAYSPPSQRRTLRRKTL